MDDISEEFGDLDENGPPEAVEELKQAISREFCAGSCWEFDFEQGTCYIPEENDVVSVTCGGKNYFLSSLHEMCAKNIT